VIARADALAAFASDHFDLAVIGGGITGAGVALDAASRGYSVALVERDDYASGTSSRSSKLVHGGLRYLQNFDLGLVREALLERSLMVELAPHLVRPLPMLVPAFGGKRPDRLMGVGLNMYDVMASDRLRRRPGRRQRQSEDVESWSPDRHRMIDADEARELLPALASREPTAAYLFYDCQTDDARLVLTVLGEAERFGAVCANACEVTELLEDEGRAAGVRFRDAIGGAELEVRADNVVNATGVWADRIKPEELYAEEEVPRIRPSRGTHITLSREDLRVEAGAIVPAGSSRTIFVLPWLGRTLVGTTDNDYEGDLDHVPPASEDIEYLLDACNRFFGTSLGENDLTGAYAGVRPLISTGDPRKSVDISRKAELYETSSGLVTITGGKLTTWRRMARMAVDRVVEREAREAPCRTHEIPLGMPIEPGELPDVAGVDEESRALLAARYGYAAREVLELAAEVPELARRIVPELPDLVVECAFAARKEQARSIADALLRRTRLGLLDGRGLCAPDAEGPTAVVRAMGGELGWDERRERAELEAWSEVARAEGLVPGAVEPAAETASGERAGRIA
jgi:glycerol-3-phosphate dehydrogenase